MLSFVVKKAPPVRRFFSSAAWGNGSAVIYSACFSVESGHCKWATRYVRRQNEYTTKRLS
jgi:hypothetical protein